MLAPILMLLLSTDAPTGIVRVSYPLDSVIAPREPGHAVMPSIAFAGGGRMYNNIAETQPIADARRVTCDEIADLVRRAISPEEWQSPGRSIAAFDEQSPALVVTAPQETQTRVRDFLAFLGTHFRRPIELRFDAYDVVGYDDALSSLGASADAKGAIAQLQAKKVLVPRISNTLHLIAGVPSTFARTRERSYLADFEVEIADSAAIHDPIVDTYSLGFTLCARADVTIDGQALLTFGARNTFEKRPLRRIEVTSITDLVSDGHTQLARKDPGFVEAPTIAFQTLAGTSVLATGTTRVAFVAPLTGNGDDERGLLLAFTVESVGAAAPTFRAGDLEVAVRDFASTMRGDGRMPTLPLSASSPRATLRAYDEPELWAPIDIEAAAMPDVAPVEVAAAVESATSDSANGASVDVHRGFLFVVGAPKTASEIADRVVAGLHASPVARDFVGVASPRVGGGDADDTGKRAIFCLPAAMGNAIAFHGVEEAVLVDADVDVANHASMSNPMVSAQFTGRFFTLAAGHDFEGGDTLDLTCAAMNAPATRDSIDHGDRASAPFDRLDADTLRWRTSLHFSKGANASSGRVRFALPGASGSEIGSGYDLELSRAQH